MFEVRYKKDNVIKTHIDIDWDTFFSLLKAHKEGKITIQYIENSSHYVYKVENLIENLQL